MSYDTRLGCRKKGRSVDKERGEKKEQKEPLGSGESQERDEKKGHKRRGVRRIVVTCIAVFAAAFLILLAFSGHWMLNNWADMTMDELIFQLSTLEGASTDMVRAYLLQNLLPTLIIIAVIVLILTLLWKRERLYILIELLALAAGAVMTAHMFHAVWHELRLGEYIRDQSEYSDFIDENYVPPDSVEISFPEDKKNLIYIYLESMEVTYTDASVGGAFEQNCIPELTDLALENECFSGTGGRLNGGLSLSGSTWTAGAMWAQTSGLPLKISIDLSTLDIHSTFFPGAETLGDILEGQKYRQVLLLGSDASFGGRDYLFSQHGNYEICDYEWAQENGKIDKDYYVWWGYEDQKLFENAKELASEMAAGDEPFNLTILTMDTHFEDGYVCERCPDTFGDNQYANVMACSSAQVTSFVEWVKEQDFYEDTVIVICGDHPTMDTDFCKDVPEDYERKVYTAYINAAVEATGEEREYSTFDNFPTTLAAMGVQIEGERLGLGTNLFSGTETLTEEYGYETEQTQIKKKSKLMEELTKTKTDEGDFPAGE